MKLLTEEQRKTLLANGREQAKVKGTQAEKDFWPVVKLFYPAGAATWFISEADPESPDILFGLCDLDGFPELGSVRLSELEAFDGRLGLGIERDLHFEAKAPLSHYAKAARKAGCIVEDIDPSPANPSEGE